MKQLVLYFMFFVGSSLVLVECARLFPTTAETSAHKPNNTNKEGFIRFGVSNKNMRNTLNAAVSLNGKIKHHLINDWFGSYIRKAGTTGN